MYITASGRCAPPDNKPTPDELNQCQPYLEHELQIIQPKVIVCLGRIAFERIVKIHMKKNPGWKFAHGAVFQLPAASLLCSYHPSQQNTLTGKLTIPMFDQIWKKARSLAETS
jgi:uracil-DNA glycosylase family 4